MIPELHLPQADHFKKVAEKVPGYSWFAHYLFFESLLHNYPKLNKFLLLGVYHGRDLAFILDILSRSQRTEFTLVGVDWFEDKASADWPEHLKDKNWEATGFGPAPKRKTSAKNAQHFCPEWVDFDVCQCEDERYLALSKQQGAIFDFVYLDTSHDFETVNRQLQQIRSITHKESIVCGDDYRDVPRWGVKQAVADNFTDWKVWDNQAWYARAEDFK